MRIVRLTKEQREFFLGMDPFYMMERLEFPGSFALAALETDETTNTDLPVGLMICSTGKDRLVIEWLFVSPEHRMKGVGEQLVLAALEAAENGSLKTVCAYMNRTDQRERICSGEEQYFMERLFGEKQALPGEWVTDIRTIAANPYFKRKKETNDQICFLRYLSGAKRSEYITALAASVPMLYPVDKNSALLDPDISLFLFQDEKLCGGFLAQCVTTPVYEVSKGRILQTGERQTLYPVLFRAASEKVAGALLLATVGAAQRKYEPDTAVHVILRDSNLAILMEKMAPEAHLESWFLTAQVQDYVEWKEKKKALEQTEDE